MSSRLLLMCQHCGERRFKSQRYLDQHLAISSSCSRAARAARDEHMRQVIDATSQTMHRSSQSPSNNPRFRGDQPNELRGESDPEDGIIMTIDSDSDQENYDLQANVVSFQDDDSWGVAWDGDQEGLDYNDPAHKHLINYKEHVAEMATNYEPFPKNEKRMINLLHVLVHKGVPLSTTEAVFE